MISLMWLQQTVVRVILLEVTDASKLIFSRTVGGGFQRECLEILSPAFSQAILLLL